MLDFYGSAASCIRKKKRTEILKCSGDLLVSNADILRLADGPYLSQK